MKKYGSAAGTRRRKSCWKREARPMRKRSTRSLSVETRPWVVFTTSGKKLMRKVMMMTLLSPGPTQSMRMGAKMMMGVSWRAMSHG